MSDLLDDRGRFLELIGSARADDFDRLGIRTIRELLYAFPRDLSDPSQFRSIADLVPGRPATVLARAASVSKPSPSAGRAGERGNPPGLLAAELIDDSGMILEAVWPDQPWLRERLPHCRLLVHGAARRIGRRLVMERPLCHPLAPDAGMEGPIPAYPVAGGLTQPIWRRILGRVLDPALANLEDPLPARLAAGKGYPGLRQAIRRLHFFARDPDWRLARNRLVWDDYFYSQLAILAARRHTLRDRPAIRLSLGPELDHRIRRLHPFRFTPAQDRVIREIGSDFASPFPARRLLQGEAGCGKATVAAYFLLAAAANQVQAFLLTTTDARARRHFAWFGNLLDNSPNSRIRAGLLAGDQDPGERRNLLERMAAGALDIVCASRGFTGEVAVFPRLGLLVVDEQDILGLHRRCRLPPGEDRAHLLVLTSLPLARSLIPTSYGGLEPDFIDASPPGRKPVKTHWHFRSRPGPVREMLESEFRRGRQALVVRPEDGDFTGEGGESIPEFLGGFRLVELGSRLGREDRRRALEDFRLGRIDIMAGAFAEMVEVEAGNATVMLADRAERFTLSQLHQLRMRVGGGPERGHFIMLSEPGREEERLAVIRDNPDGLAVAEAALELGESTGPGPAGQPVWRLADLSSDFELIRDAREEAAKLLEKDPDLTRTGHIPLRRELVRRHGRLWDRAEEY
ncbi:MAG: hypothetical protein LBU64_03195 [Planctomycetota bacterium]|jgi:ATP-dependent DNA helicase RecG|nr:hypothetical protein [Planctomycetota bacterium]